MLCGQSLVPRSEGPLSLLLTQTPPAQPSPAQQQTMQIQRFNYYYQALGQSHNMLYMDLNFEPVSTKSLINFDKI